MAEKRVGLLDAQGRLEEIVTAVAKTGDRYVVQENDHAVAVVVPVALYERWKRDRTSFFDDLDGLAQRGGLDAAEADRLADAAVAAVRGSGRSA